MHPALDQLISSLLGAKLPHDDRAIAGNFRIEERLPAAVQAEYDGLPWPGNLESLDKWRDLHGVFLEDRVQLLDDRAQARGHAQARGQVSIAHNPSQSTSTEP